MAELRMALMAVAYSRWADVDGLRLTMGSLIGKQSVSSLSNGVGSDTGSFEWFSSGINEDELHWLCSISFIEGIFLFANENEQTLL